MCSYDKSVSQEICHSFKADVCHTYQDLNPIGGQSAKRSVNLLFRPVYERCSYLFRNNMSLWGIQPHCTHWQSNHHTGSDESATAWSIQWAKSGRELSKMQSSEDNRVRSPSKLWRSSYWHPLAPHLRLLEEHLDHVLRDCIPVLLGDGGTFTSITSKRKDQSSLLLHGIMLVGQLVLRATSHFNSAEEINDVLRLYYRACIFSHRLPNWTLWTEGEEWVGYYIGLLSPIQQREGEKGFIRFMYVVLIRLANRLMIVSASRCWTVVTISWEIWWFREQVMMFRTELHWWTDLRGGWT